MNHIIYIIIVLLGVCMPIGAQNSDRDCIRMGNKYFRDKDFSKAETYYRKALEKNPSLEAFYNLGNSLTFQQNDSLAFDSYRKALGQNVDTPEKKAWVYHNMGNLSYLNGRQLMKANSPDAAKAFAQAVDCYQSALRCNPADNETRYNLALAQYMLKKNQENQDNQQHQDQQNQDQDNQDQQNQDQQDQDKQNQDQQKQDKQNQDQQNQDQQNQDQRNAQQQQAQEERGQMDDRTAEQLLNSAQQDEKGVLRKVQKVEKAHRRGLEKDW